MTSPRLLLAAALAAAAGCATLEEQRHFESHLGSQSGAVRECAEWYRALDEAIDSAGVRDAQYARLPGFPYLRVDRPLASLRDRAAASEPALQAFAERLLELDIESRRHENKARGPQCPCPVLLPCESSRPTRDLREHDMTEANDWNSKTIAEFRANEGRVGGPFDGAPMVLVHHRGRKSKRYQ